MPKQTIHVVATARIQEGIRANAIVEAYFFCGKPGIGMSGIRVVLLVLWAPLFEGAVFVMVVRAASIAVFAVVVGCVSAITELM